MQKNILIVGSTQIEALEQCYLRALNQLKFDPTIFNIDSTIHEYTKFGVLGKYVNTFLPIEEWIKKGNRKFAIEARKINPEMILVFCNSKITFNTISYLKIATNAKIGLVWPDTVFNLSSHVLSSASLYDFVACYSSESVKIFESLGFKNVFWTPLGADHHFEISTQPNEFDYQISFIGGWRPEREFYIKHIIENFPDIDLNIWGPNWERCRVKQLKKHVRGKGLYGKEFYKVINKSKINLNVIDDTNYPAANMRFFEIGIAQGLQLASSCPEMKLVFKDLESIAYFENQNELTEKLALLMKDDNLCKKIRDNSFKLVKENHLYIHRVSQILNNI